MQSHSTQPRAVREVEQTEASFVTLRLEGPRTGHALLEGQLERWDENAGIVYALR